MNPVGDVTPSHAWRPGIQSKVPIELRHLSTLFRPENVSTNLAAARELQALTGLSISELVAFRPQRLALHELLIRVTADFVVPDGSRIGDLGINFREIASLMLVRHLEPQMNEIIRVYEGARRELRDTIESALVEWVRQSAATDRAVTRMRASRWLALVRSARRSGVTSPAHRNWGPPEVAECERRAAHSGELSQRVAYRALARVLSGLFATHGHAWGTFDLIASIATDLACNEYGSDCIGNYIAPLLTAGARAEGFDLLPRQDSPVVINTKGASASGKSTLRPLQKKLAGEIGRRWRDFALISPDIWRKQLLDYARLGDAYKYAGAFTAEELQIVDQKLDRYMARKHQRGEMTHLLIDRFRFDSFAAESDEAGSNLLTRFGQRVHLFFMITPPELLVERAWKRGLEFGRYKAVDDTLAHAIEAYTGIPDVFFTWVSRGDKQIQFEFLDNTVALGDRPRTVAFGNNETCNILSIAGLLDIERYGRIDVDALGPESLYPDRRLLQAQCNTGFLQRCVKGFKQINFADQETGRIYLRLESGMPSLMDSGEFQKAMSLSDSLHALQAVVPDSALGRASQVGKALYLGGGGDNSDAATLGQWGWLRPNV